MDGFVDVYIGEPVGDEIILFQRNISGKIFTKEELSSFLVSCIKELDDVVERLSNGEFSMVFYDLTLRRADNDGFIGGVLCGGSDLSVGEAETRFSLDGLQRYRENFNEAIEEHDYIIPINSRMLLVGFRDKITNKVKSRDPYKNED